jgi:hypothetical protein
MATASELAQFCVPEQPVTLIFIHHQDAWGSASDEILRRRVIDLAARRGSDVELVEIGADEVSDELMPTGGSLLLVMRQGELFCQAAGPLPATELARMVDAALRR